MPYYGMPVGLSIHGKKVEEVGFGYNRQIIDGLLREELGYDGVIVSDWELVNDNHVGGQVLPARAWGAETLSPRERLLKILQAGVDQFGGEECVDLLIGLVEDGLVPESRIDASARRLLRVKFELGLFDNPFVDEDAADEIVGCQQFRDEGLAAQARSVVVLKNGLVDAEPALPLHPFRKIYIEGISPEVVSSFGEVVGTPEDADIALVRLQAPFQPRDDLFLESYFHQGSLEFNPGLIYRLARIADQVPIIIDVQLDRAAVLPPIARLATALTVSFGVCDQALLSAWRGSVLPQGRLPIALPRSMDDVRAVASDAGLGPEAAAYPLGYGLSIAAPDTAKS